MWIYLKDGFFSIVEHEKSNRHVVVRARVKGDLEKVFNGSFVEGPTFTPDADYRFRATIEKSSFAKVLAGQAAMIGYKNFKAAINDKERREYWYGRVWDDMSNMQEHLSMMEEVDKIQTNKKAG